MRKVLLISLLCVSAGAAPLSLRQALDTSLKNNPDVQVKRLEVEQAESSESKYFSGLLPKIEFGAQAGRRKDAPTSTRSSAAYDSYTAAFTLTQPLLKGAALWDGFHSSSKEVEVKQIDEKIARRDHSASLILAFYNVILNQRSNEVFRKQIEVQRQLLTKARERFRLGAETKLSVLQFQTQLALLEPKFTDTRTKFENAKTQLQTLISAEGLKIGELRGTIEKLDDLPLPRFAAGEVNRRFEIQRQELLIEQQAHNWGVTMSEHYPSLWISGEYGRTGDEVSDLHRSSNNAWSLGLNLSVPIFSGLSSMYQRRILAEQEAELRVTQKSLRNNLLSESDQIQKDLNSVREQLRASRTAYDLATQSQAEARRLYNLGRVDYPRLFETLSNVIEAELALDQVRTQFLALVVRSYVATGRDLSELIDKL